MEKLLVIIERKLYLTQETLTNAKQNMVIIAHYRGNKEININQCDQICLQDKWRMDYMSRMALLQLLI